MYMKVLDETVICIGLDQGHCISREAVTHRNQGGHGTEAGQHPRLNRERNLWKWG